MRRPCRRRRVRVRRRRRGAARPRGGRPRGGDEPRPDHLPEAQAHFRGRARGADGERRRDLAQVRHRRGAAAGKASREDHAPSPRRPHRATREREPGAGVGHRPRRGAPRRTARRPRRLCVRRLRRRGRRLRRRPRPSLGETSRRGSLLCRARDPSVWRHGRSSTKAPEPRPSAGRAQRSERVYDVHETEFVTQKVQ